MSSSPASTAPTVPTFVCDCDEKFRSACQALPFYHEHGGKRYCVLHFPNVNKAADFGAALRQKLDAEDFDFGGAWFPDAHSFRGLRFGRAAIFKGVFFNAPMSFIHSEFDQYADFTDAVFNDGVEFTLATFHSGAYFADAQFRSKADLNWIKFEKDVNFREAVFEGEAVFEHSTFNEIVRFTGTKFNSSADFYFSVFNDEAEFFAPTFNGTTIFHGAWFKGYLRVSVPRHEPVFGDEAWLDLRFAKVEKPEHISFSTITLRPHWFVNIDARAFDFTDVRWRVDIPEEIDELERKNIHPAHPLLSITYRRLARNAEENERYDEASAFRYHSMDIRRQEKAGGLAFWKLNWWYWAASGYGERIIRASLILLAIWLTFSLLYTRVGFTRWQPKATNEQEAASVQDDDLGSPLSLPRSLMYSLGVLTLQKPEPPPATSSAEVLVTLETILGPLQAALLALAIRRKFMR